MAASKKKKRSSTNSNQKNISRGADNLVYVIAAVFIFALAIYFFVSFFGKGGSVGDAISKAVKGAFGWAAWVVPVAFFGLFLYFGRLNRYSLWKIIPALLSFFCLTAIFDLIHSGGGKAGEKIAGWILPPFGKIGSFILIFILFIICIFLIAGDPFAQKVREKSDELKQKSAEQFQKAALNSQTKKELRAQETLTRKQEERERLQDSENQRVLRAEQKVRGVNPPNLKESIPKTTVRIKDIEIPKADANGAPSYTQNTRALLPWEKEDPAAIKLKPAGETLKADIVINREKANSKAESKNKQLTNKNTDKEKPENFDISSEIDENAEETAGKVYKLPDINLLSVGKDVDVPSDEELREKSIELGEILSSFGVGASVTHVNYGPTVTRFELAPEPGVKVSRIVALTDDIKLNLAASDIRIEAPIPGKAAVGIEVPNKVISPVLLRGILESEKFCDSKAGIPLAIGKDVAGQAVIADLSKMPHLLVAGTTGSGKSVGINCMILSILYKSKPEDVKLIMIDPKVVELNVYNRIPHLLVPVVTDPRRAAGALSWAVHEMKKRYELFALTGVRDINAYNLAVERCESEKHLENENNETTEEVVKPDKLPKIVIIVDELADLMMVAAKEVEDSICRLAQLARAAGIHLVVATQRPSVDVITGLIKANMPSRIAFSVASGVDSRTILDMVGAEKLLGNGDMLFYPSGFSKPLRVQGAYVSTEEIEKVANFLKEQAVEVQYDDEISSQIDESAVSEKIKEVTINKSDDADTYIGRAGLMFVVAGEGTIGLLQRKFKIGFNRAARIMDSLVEAGVVGGLEDKKPKKALVSVSEYIEIAGANGWEIPDEQLEEILGGANEI
ncbi:MAG: DNA translocase FtsK [Lachnospiraceae bacterium]|nr:DNA translocase FtsK [Lachnospiraceae bacterium]